MAIKTTFESGQRVNGKVCGQFIVVETKCYSRPYFVDGCEYAATQEIVTLREIGPQGQLARKKIKLTSDCLVAA